MQHAEKPKLSGIKPNFASKYLKYASSIISAYKCDGPFHLYLKKYFLRNKKHGSKDRKIITCLCYNYFRMGNAIAGNSYDRFLIATFLCENDFSLVLSNYRPDLNKVIRLPIEEKIKMLTGIFFSDKLFCCPAELGEGIDPREYALSFLQQPGFFLRVRPGFLADVEKKLRASQFAFFREEDTSCISIPKHEKIEDVIDIDRECVIQDLNSQKTIEDAKKLFHESHVSIRVWDCCAGSGGKSILLNDMIKNVELTVSDKRKGILDNLENRFAKAGIKKYTLCQIDLEKGGPELQNNFDMIIADVPCSGSGTWARTPEELGCFKKKKIEKYANLQKKILVNVVPHLAPKGYLFYITCSVFRKENEDNVKFLSDELNLELTQMLYLKGYRIQSDSMFVAILQKK
jgi:16S rRNA (cytosine967-C5)-methyltransferase